ncbi:MAG: hypothetical protein IJK42_11000 [Prevotella sp.]|nr:hypothetical protein [Prevotella sp.]MBQ6210277.1 hypothetical protein [Prevotella sp.]
MSQQNKRLSILFLIGGLLMVIGVGCFVFLWQQRVVCWLFLAGATLFSVVQMMQSYEGESFTVRRLKRIQDLAGILFILSGVLMADTAYRFLLPLFMYHGDAGYYEYMSYVYNKWVVILLIAVFLEVYTTHRISAELKKE